MTTDADSVSVHCILYGFYTVRCCKLLLNISGDWGNVKSIDLLAHVYKGVTVYSIHTSLSFIYLNNDILLCRGLKLPLFCANKFLVMSCNGPSTASLSV